MKQLRRHEEQQYRPGGPARLRQQVGRLLLSLRRHLGVHLLVIVFSVVLLGMAGSSFLTLSIQHAQLVESAQLSARRVNDVLQTSLEYAMLNNDRHMVDQMLVAVVGDGGIEHVRVLDAQGGVRASSLASEVGQNWTLGQEPCNACHSAAGAAQPGPLPMVKMQPQALFSVNVIRNAPACHACHDAGTAVLGLLLVETPMTELHAQLAASRERLLLAGLGTFTLLAAVLIPAVRAFVSRPVKKLADAAAEIGAGNLDFPVALAHNDELGQLGLAFDDMRQQLKQARRDMEERQEELRMLNEVARAASHLLDPQQILELSINLVASSPGIVAGGIYLLDQDCGKYHLRACHGISELDCARVGYQLQAQRRRTTEAAWLVEGVLILPARSEGDGGSPDTRDCAWVSVPLLAGGVEIGSMALITAPRYRLSDQAIHILKTMGEEIGIALKHALQYQQAHYRAAIEERDRLAREMHDSLAQTLGYLKLKASLTDQLLASGDVDQAQTQLREVKAIAGATYTDVRETIFGLRHQQTPGADFLPALEEFLAEYRTYYGVDVQLALANGHRPTFSPDVTVQVTRIIQEALTNVRKHAGVKQAYLWLEQVNGTWRITVEDQGRGFEPRDVGRGGLAYMGLQIMRERAESVGGRLELASTPECGTRVILSIPAADNGA